MKLTVIIVTASLPSAVSFAPGQQKSFVSRYSYDGDGSPSSICSVDDPNSEYAQWMTSLIQGTHMPGQTQLQPFRSPFLSRIIGGNDWKEWHYSFSLNGYTDFLPQYMDSCDCMALDITTAGQESETRTISSAAMIENARLPWQHGDGDSEDVDFMTATSSITNVVVSSGDQLSTNAVDDDMSYDCILDSGVMNGIISSLPSEVTWHSRTGPPALIDLVKLLSEASQAIREYGIYVAITDQEIPEHAKGYLSAMGEMIGMDWNYDLDGLSKQGYHVSVARKQYAGLVNFDPSSFTVSDDKKNLLKP